MIEYDPETDTAYLKIQEGNYLESEEISAGVILDYDQNENVIALELLGVKSLQPSQWQSLKSQMPVSAYEQLQVFFANASHV
ncbi:DUF2283 domain-containing protein [Picosynechococcus sp. NKBG15041c]|uniref:DUF2283 domain-containing protein n=1 Tax=Picosynechococcus sp. NKBG15041c TaxID=1407650 RepID=UPI00041755E7|nr:DUF2283 domain-containing protein [Picosynechococcus sp. NKBG15041c]